MREKIKVGNTGGEVKVGTKEMDKKEGGKHKKITKRKVGRKKKER